MTKRLSDKKPMKISFNEYPDEPEFNYNWDVNFSSDEDIFFKGKSEVLWSRSGDLFDSLDSYQSFSDVTERTFSSCSWHNDEFDMKSSYKVNASLEAIDDALYERVKAPFLNDTLFQECCDWSEKFPYFRIKGQKIVSYESENFVPFSNSSSNIKEYSARNSSTSLHLEGKKLPIHSASKNRNIPENNISTCIEELVDDEDIDEEYFAIHKSDQSCDNIQVPTADDSEAHSTFKLIQEKILDKLVSEMWPSVLAFLENIDKKTTNNVNNDFQLPPITVANVPKTALHLKRPNTEGSNVLITAFPKLDSILSVSPKVLQKREHGYINRTTRPNSEMSVNIRVSSKSLKSAYHHANCVEISEFPQVKCPKSDKEAEGLSLVLPALEEDLQDSTNVLRGFHIEPHSRNSANKTVHPLRKEALSRESDCFLPPITHTNYLPSDIKLTKNLFTFYGSPVRQNRNKYTSSAKYKKTNSRPNTSVSKQSILNSEVSQLAVNSELYITARGVSKTSSNMHSETNSDVVNDNDEKLEENQEKSVTLFPIVKSLTPHEDKNSCVKRGILHTFLRGKKR